MTVRTIESYGWTKPTAEGKANFEQALSDLAKMTSIDVGTNSYKSSECGGFSYGLYPAFLRALYYEPNVTLTGKGITYFGLGNWYIPDSREMERLIYYRINSTITDNTLTENSWNGTTVGRDVSGQGWNVFNANAFANIDFLKDTSSQITSVSTVQGEGLAYGYISYYGSNSTPKWGNECFESWTSPCARDVAHSISPVCRIELIES